MIIVKPSKDILQLNKGFRFERNSTAFDEQGKLYYPHNARFQAGKFGKALFVEEGTENLVTGVTWQQGGLSSTNGKGEPGDNRIRTGFIPVSAAATYTFLAHHDEYIIAAVHEYRNDSTWIYRTITNTENPTLKLSEETTQIRALMRRHDQANLTPAHAVIAKPQIEKLPYPTTFVNGTRAAETLTIPTEGVLNAEEGTIEFWVKNIANMYDAALLFDWRLANGIVGFIIGISGSKLFFQVGQHILWGAGKATYGTDWRCIACKWSSEKISLSIDGIIIAFIDSPTFPTGLNPIVGIGGHSSSGIRQCNTLIDDLRISNIARSDEGILAAYESNQPLPVDQYTTCKLGFDGPDDVYVRQGLII